MRTADAPHLHERLIALEAAERFPDDFAASEDALKADSIDLMRFFGCMRVLGCR